MLITEALDSGIIAFPDFIKSLTSRIEQEPDLTVAGRGKSSWVLWGLQL